MLILMPQIEPTEIHHITSYCNCLFSKSKFPFCFSFTSFNNYLNDRRMRWIIVRQNNIKN